MDGASVYFDGEYKGQIHSGVLSVGVYTTATPYETVSVRMDGYYTASTSLPATPSAGETTNVYVTLNPKPTDTESEYGSIYVSTSPSGARIHLNDQYQGLSPITLSGLRAGSYSIDAEMDGYETSETTVYVTAGSTKNVYLTLVSPGSVSVESSPGDAYVYVNGNLVGKTPYVVTGLSSGDHEFMVTMNGYYNWKKTVNVVEGEQISLYAVLQLIDQTQEILVTSNPSGAKIYLDGVYQGETMENQAFPITGVSVGIHSLVLQLDGYPDYSTSVSIVSGGNPVEIDAEMSKTPSRSTGSIYITSTPSGATIYLDYIYMSAQTPYTLTGVTAGEHTVTLRLSGYNDGMSKITVTAGETAQLTIGLSSSSGGTTEPTPTTSTPGFTLLTAVTALGAVLVVFVSKKR
ncbi:PEGA domain-containing protein [Methanolacinia petrolearia]|uniref:PEGA domain-containing protein n=1 Tax=Methanolacinia petrolearia TaxID=54120 RepID=UPI003BAD1DE1